MKHKCPVCDELFMNYEGAVVGALVHRQIKGLKQHLAEVHPDYDMYEHYPEYMSGFADPAIVVQEVQQ